MIELQGITKSFGSLQVLKGIDLTIDKGEVVSIVGPSGAGKTTLFQIMGPFKAGFYQTFAALFGASLKKEYHPEGEDRLTERVVLLVENGQI
jgi:ABC-type multidrug transport system ATPase subunit